MSVRFPSLRISNTFAGNVLKLVGGTTAAQALTVLTAPVISRLFPPEAFGTTSVFISLVSVFSVVVCWRYDQAILLPKEDDEAANLFLLSLTAAAIVSALAAFFLVFNSGWLASALKAPAVSPFLWLVPIALLSQGLFLSVNQWNTRRKVFGRLSIARVAASLTTSLLPVVLALSGYANTTGLILSWLAGTLIFTATLSSQVLYREVQFIFKYLNPGKILQIARRYQKFPLVDTWGSFINNLSWQLPSLMLSGFFNQTVVGHYAMASRFILLPMTLVGHSIAQVFFQHASETRSNQGDLAKVANSLFQRLVGLSMFPAMVLAVVGRELFIFVLGSNWADAGAYAQILAPWLFFLFISSPLSSLFNVLERQELALLVHGSILLTRFLSLYIGGTLDNIVLSLALWSGTGILVYGALALWNLRLSGVRIQTSVLVLGKYFLVCSPLVLFLVILKYWAGVPALWTLLAAGFSSLLYYVWLVRSDPSMVKILRSLRTQAPNPAGNTLDRAAGQED